MKPSAIPNIVSALTARTQLGQILRRVKTKNERFVVDRRGEPEAVILSLKDYLELAAPAPAWLKRMARGAKRRGTATITSRQIDAEIRAYRRGVHTTARAR
jgi:prevent-host-death family protein